MIKSLNADETGAAMPWLPLIDAIDDMFRTGCEMPVRHHHGFGIPGEEDGTLLLMPAWTEGAYLGVKMVNVVPGNSARSLPAISGSYLLSSAATGAVLALMDGAELTARRTAAASAVAARYLARKDAGRLLVVGAGKLSLNVIAAHSAVRDITHIDIWARRPEQATDVAAQARELGYNAHAVADLEPAARAADIITCCTLSRVPLVLGEWIAPGTHIDLIGAFKPDMRETDDAAVAKAQIFADTREGVMAEGGDILQPLRAGTIDETHIKADLYDLSRGNHPGRTDAGDITLFKSVGAALEDLAAAILVYQNA